MSDINLLPKKNEGSIKEGQVDAVFRRIAFVILFATASVSLILFILVWQSPLSKAQEQEDALLGTMKGYDTKISRNVIIQERLQSIAQVIKTRSQYEKDLQILFSLLPSEVSLDAVTVSKNTIQITGTASSLVSINSFFDNIIGLKEKKTIVKSILLQTFVFQSSTGRYYFSLQITLL